MRLLYFREKRFKKDAWSTAACAGASGPDAVFSFQAVLLLTSHVIISKSKDDASWHVGWHLPILARDVYWQVEFD